TAFTPEYKTAANAKIPSLSAVVFDEWLDHATNSRWTDLKRVIDSTFTTQTAPAGPLWGSTNLSGSSSHLDQLIDRKVAEKMESVITELELGAPKKFKKALIVDRNAKSATTKGYLKCQMTGEEHYKGIKRAFDQQQGLVLMVLDNNICNDEAEPSKKKFSELEFETLRTPGLYKFKSMTSENLRYTPIPTHP
ncbi:hypothetical protein PROFUN_16899, partial [Planoprotostelium fungivorum]